MGPFYSSRMLVWFKNEIGRALLFCDIYLAINKESYTLWELAIQLETDGLFRALTYLDKFRLSLPSGYRKV